MKQLAFTFLLFSFFSQQGTAQSQDSLLFLIRQEGVSDTSRILALSELAYQLQSTNASSSLSYALQANTLSEKIGYDKGLGRSTRVIGNFYLLKSNYPRSLSFFQIALGFSKKAGDKNNIARCYGNIALIYRNEGNYEKAIENYSNSIKIHEEMDNKQGIASVYNNIAAIYDKQENNEKALEYFFKSLALDSEIGDQASVAVTDQNIGFLYYKEKQYSKALEYYQKAVLILEQINDKHTLTYCYSNLADLYLDLKKMDKVLSYLDKAFAAAKEIQAMDRIAEVKTSYAKYYLANNNPDLAYRYASESQILANKIGNLETRRNASEQRYLASKRLGKHNGALQNYELFVSLDDSLRNEQIHRRTLSMEYAMKEEKIKLEQERKELLFNAEQERQKRIATITGGIVFVFLGVGLYLLYRIWSNKNKKELAGMRARISRDIHDDMGSNLSTISILSNVAVGTLSNSEDIKAKELLGKINTMSHLVIKSMDEIVWSIAPHHDSFKEIVKRMRLLGGQLENLNITFSFFVEGDPNGCNLNLEQRHDFYLIFKETINNIAKYARCKHVVVNLVVKTNHIKLLIIDDGVGFNMDSVAGGNGLSNIRSRAKNLNGQLKIESEINLGTRTELEFLVLS